MQTANRAGTSGRIFVLVLLIAVAVIGGSVLFFHNAGFDWLRVDNPGKVELTEAWATVRQSPQDPMAWQRLGDAQASVDQTRSAEESFRTAIRLTDVSERGELYGRFGFLLYSRGLDRPALNMFERADALGVDLPMLNHTLLRLRSALPKESEAGEVVTPVVPQGYSSERRQDPKRIRNDATSFQSNAPEAELGIAHVEADEAQQECTIPLTRAASGVYLVQMVIGTADVKLVVDTGASITALAEDFVLEQGIEVNSEASIMAVTAAGRTRLSTATVPWIALGTESVANKTVAVCDQCGGVDAVGLMGLDLQAALRVLLDLPHNQLRFVDCAP